MTRRQLPVVAAAAYAEPPLTHLPFREIHAANCFSFCGRLLVVTDGRAGFASRCTFRSVAPLLTITTSVSSIVFRMRGLVSSSLIRRLNSAFPIFSLSTCSHFSTRPSNENETETSVKDDANTASAAIASLSGEFHADDAERVANALNPAQRVLLASALREQIQPDNLGDAYFDQLWAASTRQGQMTE